MRFCFDPLLMRAVICSSVNGAPGRRGAGAHLEVLHPADPRGLVVRGSFSFGFSFSFGEGVHYVHVEKRAGLDSAGDDLVAFGVGDAF
jgi:hypothetical protein